MSSAATAAPAAAPRRPASTTGRPSAAPPANGIRPLLRGAAGPAPAVSAGALPGWLLALLGTALRLSPLGLLLALGGSSRLPQPRQDLLPLLDGSRADLGVAFDALEDVARDLQRQGGEAAADRALPARVARTRREVGARLAVQPPQYEAAAAALASLFAALDLQPGTGATRLELARRLVRRHAAGAAPLRSQAVPLAVPAPASADRHRVPSAAAAAPLSRDVAASRALVSALASLRQSTAELEAEVRALERPGLVPTPQDVAGEQARLRRFARGVAQARAQVDRLQAQAREAASQGRITAAREQALADALTASRGELDRLLPRFLRARAQAFTRAVGEVENALRQGGALPCGGDLAACRALANHAQWYGEQAGQPVLSPPSRRGFERRVAAALSRPSGVATPSRPMPGTEERWRELSSSDLGEQIAGEAARNGWDREATLRAVEDGLRRGLTMAQILALLRDGELGVGGPPRRPPRRWPVTHAPSAPEPGTGDALPRPRDVTARQLPASQLALPRPAAPGPAQRTGLQFTLSLENSYDVMVRLWTQNSESLPANLWPQLMNTFDRKGPLEGVADVLTRVLPPDVGFRVSFFPPPPIGLPMFGVERLSSLVVPIDQAVRSGAVQYTPKSGYRLNLRETPAGPELAVPLQAEVVEVRGVEPFKLPGLRSLPLHPSWKSEVIKVWPIELSGRIEPRLAAAFTRGVNQGPLNKELWYYQGDLGVQAKWRLRFALDGSVPREGTYRLPDGWSSLAAHLVPEALRNVPDKVLKSHWWGLGLRVGPLLGASVQFFRQRIESSPGHDARELWGDLGRSWPLSPNDLAGPAAPSGASVSLEPFEYLPPSAPGQPGRVVPRSVVASPGDPLAQAAPHSRPLDPGATTSLVFPGRNETSLTISGAVLNALSGHPVAASDIPAIDRFLRSLDPAASGRGASGRGWLGWNAEAVREVVRAITPGQPLPAHARQALHQAIGRYARSLPSAPGTLALPGP